jgi:threonine dehydratase
VQHIDITDQAIVSAQLSAWEELRIGLEGGGATALAALLSGAYRPQHDEVVGVVSCGGNVDIAALLKAAS